AADVHQRTAPSDLDIDHAVAWQPRRVELCAWHRLLDCDCLQSHAGIGWHLERLSGSARNAEGSALAAESAFDRRARSDHRQPALSGWTQPDQKRRPDAVLFDDDGTDLSAGGATLPAV